MKNNKGFTLVELIAIVVIIGVIMTVAIPNTISMLERNKKNSFVNDAVKLIGLAKAEVAKDMSIELPKRDTFKRATIINLAYMKTNDLKDSPYGKPYNRKHSFVVIAYRDNQYVYFATLTACVEAPDGDCDSNDTAHTVVFEDKETLAGDKSYKLVKEVRKVNPYIYIEDGETQVGQVTLLKLRDRLKDPNFSDTLETLNIYVR